MKELVSKEFAKRLLPPLAIEGVGLLRSAFTYLSVRHLLRRNAVLRGRYAGQDVYVLANGPSLNNFDLSSLTGRHVITMNHFHLHPLSAQFKPVAHCMGDPLSEWASQDPSPMIRGVDAATYWVNVDSHSLFSKFSDKPVHYYFQAIRCTAKWIEGSDLGSFALYYQSSAQMAMMVALYMGFHRIYLLGFDHDWLVSRGHSPHFYDEQEGVALADLSRYTYTEMITISLNLFQTYGRMASIARRAGCEVINLSDPSYLDVFPMAKRSSAIV